MEKKMHRLTLVLVIGSGVAAILLGTWLALSSPEPEPLAEVRFRPSRPAYVWGEEVTLILENRGEVSFCHTAGSYSIERLVRSTWLRAESHSSVPGSLVLEPGEVWKIPWGPRVDPYWPHSGAVEVVPGDYRMKFYGRFCVLTTQDSVTTEDSLGSVELIAYFELI